MGLGCAAMRQRAVTYARRHRRRADYHHNRPSAGAAGNPLGGWTGHTGAACARQRQAHRVGGGQHVRLRGTRLTRTLCGDGSSRDRTHQWLLGVRLGATRSERRATRCRARGARHNGSLVNPTGRASGSRTKRSFSAVTAATLPNSPLCLVGSAN